MVIAWPPDVATNYKQVKHAESYILDLVNKFKW